jgi:hypothetical protein
MFHPETGAHSTVSQFMDGKVGLEGRGDATGEGVLIASEVDGESSLTARRGKRPIGTPER